MRIQSWNYLDTVEVIGSIPVAPIELNVVSSASPLSFLLGADRVRPETDEPSKMSDRQPVPHTTVFKT